MGASRWVGIAFALAGILVAIVLSKTFTAVLGWFRLPDYALIGSHVTVSTVVAWLLALGAVIYAWRNPKYNELGSEVVQELRKVTWPTWAETRIATVVVVITTVIISIILFLFDQIWSYLTNLVYT